MRLIRNTTYIRAQKSRAKWLTLGGFLLFVTGFGLIAVMRNPVWSYLTIIPAYVLFIAGMQQLGKWTNSPRKPRGDLLIDQVLKNLPDRYTLIHYTKIGKQNLEHVLLHPGGALVIVLRDVQGRIRLDGKHFRKTSNPLTRVLGASGPPLGQPDDELDRSVGALETLLADEQKEIDVSGVVVFTAADHLLEENDPQIDAISIADLPDYVRILEADASFRQGERDQIAALLSTGDGFERDEPARSRRPVVVKRRAT
jgi:hypothetical protein